MPDPTVIVPAPELPAAPAAAPAAPAPNVPAAPAAPAAAPAAGDPPVLLPPTTPPAAPTTPQDQTVVYEKTGDPGLDIALKYVGQRGIGPDHPAMVAAKAGDFTQLDAAFKGLGDKAKDYQDILELAKHSYGRQQAAVLAAGAAVQKAVYDAVGGKDKWALILPFVQANADEAERAQINAAFKAGGIAATVMAQHLAGLYAKHGTKATPQSAVKADAASAATSSQAMAPREYAKAVRDLHAKLGPRMETSPEYAQLKARRAAFRAA